MNAGVFLAAAVRPLLIRVSRGRPQSGAGFRPSTSPAPKAPGNANNEGMNGMEEGGNLMQPPKAWLNENRCMYSAAQKIWP